MQKELFDIIVDKYLQGEASTGEKRLIEEYLLRMEKGVELSEKEIAQSLWDIHYKIKEEIETQKAPVIRFRAHRAWIGVAAAAIILAFTGIYYFTIQSNKLPVKSGGKNLTATNFSPGGNKAILTLQDGRQIMLDTAANGALITQGGVQLVKADGKLAYDGKGNEIAYNTITTPKGGQYQVVLSDGTKVWLNSSASIHFPTSFSSTASRRVKITGEAYFEVAQNASKSFLVSVGDMEVKVLGTHFNVNAYKDEEIIKTTLLEGSIQVSVAGVSGEKFKSNRTYEANTVLLKPGQQSQLTNKGIINIINNADTEAAIAWKNGLFKFNGEDLQTVMKQIERWYNVEVVYEGKPKPVNFGGVISRKENAAAVLDLMALTGQVKFRIEPSATAAGKIVVIL